MNGMEDGHLLVLMRDASWFAWLDEAGYRPSEVTAGANMNFYLSFGMLRVFLDESEVHLSEDYADISDRLE